MTRTIRVDAEVEYELYRRRLPNERNHNGAIRRALEEFSGRGRVVTPAYTLRASPRPKRSLIPDDQA